MIEALKLNRRVIYNDLNPYAFFVAKNLTSPLCLSTLENAFNSLMKNIHTKYSMKLGQIYSTKCKCGADKKILYVLWSLLYRRNSIKQKKRSNKCIGKLDRVASRIYNAVCNEEFTHYDFVKTLKKNFNLKKVKPHLITNAVNSILVKQGLFEVVGEKPLSIVYDSRCKCGLSGKEVEKGDLLKLKKIKDFFTSCECPTDELKYDNGSYFLKQRTVSRLDELFTQRNLIVLSLLRSEIESLQCTREIKNALLFCFSSILFASSKMQRLRGGSWAIGCYWVPPTFIEKNVLELFKRRYHNFLKWKKEAFSRKYLISEKIEDVLNGSVNAAYIRKDARELPIPNESIDYVIVDPPQTNEIQYFELSFLAAKWLKFKLPFDREIIVNPRQRKCEEDYWRMMNAAFQEFVRVLKPRGRITVMLHGEEKEYFRSFEKMFKAFGLKMISNTYKGYKFKNHFHKNDKKRLNGDYYVTLNKFS